MKHIKSLGLLLGLLGSITISAQTTLNSAGGSKVVAGNTHSWSVGEMTVVNTATAGNIVVTHGVLQPDNSAAAVSDATLPGSFEVFPNPTTDAVRFRYQFPYAGTLHCMLLDVTGKKLLDRSYPVTAGNGTEILSLQDFAVGTYVLQIRLTDSKQAVYSTAYTIQKTR